MESVFAGLYWCAPPPTGRSGPSPRGCSRGTVEGVEGHFPGFVGEGVLMDAAGVRAGPIDGGGDVGKLGVRGLYRGDGAWHAGGGGRHHPCGAPRFVAARVTF